MRTLKAWFITLTTRVENAREAILALELAKVRGELELEQLRNRMLTELNDDLRCWIKANALTAQAVSRTLGDDTPTPPQQTGWDMRS